MATTEQNRTRHDGGALEDRPVVRPNRDAVRADLRHEEFGGLAPGSVFFGWLVAVGVAALLAAIIAAAGAATGLTDVGEGAAEEIGLGGAIVLTIALAIAYYAGGYVAGRLARFDGARQGFGVWLLGLVVTLLLAAAGAILGSEYNVYEQLNLPRIPIDEGTLTTGAAVTLGAIALVTLIAAIAGGKVGERFHRRVDRVGWDV
jgi:hypothetical protein